MKNKEAGVRIRRVLRFCGIAVLGLTAAVLLDSYGPAQSVNGGGRLILNNTPGFVGTARNRGPEDPSKLINVTVWLRLHNSSALDDQLQQLYDPNAPNYHHWLAPADIKTSFAPTAAEALVVQKFLAAHNLSVVSVDANNLSVKALGRVGDVQSAFHVQINRFETQGATYRANTSDPVIEGPAGSLVAAVGGLDNYGYKPHFVRPVDPETGAAFPAVPLAAGPNGVFFEAQCFRKPEIRTFTTGGGLPAAIYFGNRYGADITNTQPGTLPPCGYAPGELQTAYNLTGVYQAGFDGTGQTVVIVDAFGSPTIQADAELFSQVYGLPDLTASNFQVICPSGQCTQTDQGWATETTLDVEWSHAVAPGAKIVLLVAATNNFDDLNAAIVYAINNQLGNVISNSYGAPESEVPPSLLDSTNAILKMAAAQGISVNFSSGDDGDFLDVLTAPTVSFPASSPWATAIGGTSLALNPDNSMAFQTGWGNNLTRIVDTIASGSPPVVPPLHQGFVGGAGGGPSGYFAKPRFQRTLRGKSRQLPDISYLADPFTGVEEICDGNSCGGPPGPGVFVIGGTSLACPMFSALWAIVAEKGGEDVPGQAAPLVYELPRRAVTDVVPVSSPADVSGIIVQSTGITFLSPPALAAPLENTNAFYSAIYNSPFSTRWFVITFGTDSSLTTEHGWDNVTGMGTPNGLSFVNAVTK